MLGMNLATLSIPELRRVLDIARARDQADLADSVLAELRARAEAPAAGVADGPAMGFTGLEPSRLAVAGMRDGPWWDDDEDPDLSPRRRAPVLILGIAAALLVAGGLGWGLTRLRAPDATAPTPPPAVAAAPVATARVEAPVVVPEPGPTAAPTAAAPDDAASAAPPAADPVKPVAEAAPAPKPSPCLTRPTPADRLVCGYPTLSRQHDRMLAAYNRALVMSGSDPLVMDADQAKWRAMRDRVSDRAKLAELYQQRIRDLDAIAARPAPEAEAEPKPKPEQPIF